MSRSLLVRSACLVSTVLLLSASFLAIRPFTVSGKIPGQIGLRSGLDPQEKMTAFVDRGDFPKAVRMYSELTGRGLSPGQTTWSQSLDGLLNGRLTRWRLVKPIPVRDSGICYHRDGRFCAEEIKEELETLFSGVGLTPVPFGKNHYRLIAATFKPARVEGVCAWSRYSAPIRGDNPSRP